MVVILYCNLRKYVKDYVHENLMKLSQQEKNKANFICKLFQGLGYLSGITLHWKQLVYLQIVQIAPKLLVECATET